MQRLQGYPNLPAKVLHTVPSHTLVTTQKMARQPGHMAHISKASIAVSVRDVQITHHRTNVCNYPVTLPIGK